MAFGRTCGWLAPVVTGLVLVGCGGDDPASTGPASTAPSLAADSAGEVTPSSASGPAGTVTPSLPDSDYCRGIAATESIDEVQRADPADPAAVEAAVTLARQALTAIDGAAPEAIRPDWATLRASYERLFGAYETAGFDLMAMMGEAAATGVFEELGSAAVTEAAARIEQFTIEACGVGLGLGDAEGGTDGGALDLEAAAAVMTLDDAALAELGARLLDGLGIPATRDQAACVGRAISDPTLAETATPAGALDRTKALAEACGIDPSLVEG